MKFANLGTEIVFNLDKFICARAIIDRLSIELTFSGGEEVTEEYETELDMLRDWKELIKQLEISNA